MTDHRAPTTITVVGAGAIGGTMGAFLTDAGYDVTLVDKDVAHVDAMNVRGLRITGVRGDRTFRVRARVPEDVRGPLGTVLLAVKAQATGEALRHVAPLLAPEGVVVSMQNGLCEEEIAAVVGSARTVGCLVYYAADYLGPGHIELGSDHEIYFGELDGSITPRLLTLTAVMNDAMRSLPTDNIWGWKWSKMCFLSLYFVGALLDVPMHEALARAEYRPVYAQLVAEAVRVANTLGYRRLESYHGFVPEAFSHGHTSDSEAVLAAMSVPNPRSLKVFSGMQRDIMVRKRPTEVDQMPGSIVSKARTLGIGVPIHAELVRLIKEIEQGRRGLGWANLDALALAAPR